MELAIGQLFADRFQILGPRLGGGTALVHQAFDQLTSTLVAIKIFIYDRRDQDVVNEFWNREVTALTRLSHPAIVKMVDAGRDPISGQPFIALEWVQGTTLDNRLTLDGSLTWQSLMGLFGSSVLDALSYAAEQNVWHRDLSPNNIMLLPDGSMRIIDFGQAKVSELGFGRTVGNWKTIPYSPPEDDSGRYTQSRDPYAFCAIALRALCGRPLKSHDELYSELARLSEAEPYTRILQKGLSRAPEERHQTIFDLVDEIAPRQRAEYGPDELDAPIPIRFLPDAISGIEPTEVSVRELLLAELNDSVAVTPAPTGQQGSYDSRLVFETANFRINANLDDAHPSQLVVYQVMPRRFRIDALLSGTRWSPRVEFTTTLPLTPTQRAAGANAIAALYRGLETFLAGGRPGKKRSANEVVYGWERLLDALRHAARNLVPALQYSSPIVEGNQLTVTLANPSDAKESELRTISVNGRWVFRGEVIQISGNRCSLLSNRARIDQDAIPAKGLLEIDWQQAKVALDRQARAVEKFSSGEVPNQVLASILKGELTGLAEPMYASISHFYDQSLDASKKAVVSRFMHGDDILVTHGPPGTGKTKLIVELIRQALAADPNCKILLVSQTHVALDNALERLLRADPSVPCVRIGSGTKELDPRVAKCSVEERGKALRNDVEASAREFISARAASLEVDRSQVELGLLAFDVISLQQSTSDLKASIGKLELELEQAISKAGSATAGTEEVNAHKLRARNLDAQIDRLGITLDHTVAELTVARSKLLDHSTQGRELSILEAGELLEWADLLIENDAQRSIGALIRLAEDWKLRFGQSDDFKSAIIASTNIVAGTCVGFCREEAASRTTFDLCIIDEAGKATTTELLVPLAQARRAVILGDHHQLPAVIDDALYRQEVLDRFDLTKDQVEVQLFEELTRSLDAGSLAKLDNQYRMRGAIGALVSHVFYDDLLLTDPSTAERTPAPLGLAGLASPVTWIDPYAGDHRAAREKSFGTSFASPREILCILSVLRRILFVLKSSVPKSEWPSIAVITGYGAQAEKLATAIAKEKALDAMNVECATVHSFQGREVDICIYSVVRNNSAGRIGMLRDWRHLNVALSRARDYLVIVGSLPFCENANNPNPFAPIVAFVRGGEGCTVKVWSDAD